MKFIQGRPRWCPHKDCMFKRISQDKICGGELVIPQPHDPGGPPVNTHRFCLKDALPNDEIFDLMVHNQDIESMRWIFDSLDGKKTSWMSQLEYAIFHDKDLIGKYIICYEYGTHGAIPVWEEKYGSFNKKEDAEKVIKDKSWLFTWFIENEKMFPYKKIN